MAGVGMTGTTSICPPRLPFPLQEGRGKPVSIPVGTWGNPKIRWQIHSGPRPTRGACTSTLWRGASPYWPAILITNLPNGLHGVEVQGKNGVWAPASMLSDQGQVYILPVDGGSPVKDFKIRLRGRLRSTGRAGSNLSADASRCLRQQVPRLHGGQAVIRGVPWVFGTLLAPLLATAACSAGLSEHGSGDLAATSTLQHQQRGSDLRGGEWPTRSAGGYHRGFLHSRAGRLREPLWRWGSQPR